MMFSAETVAPSAPGRSGSVFAAGGGGVGCGGLSPPQLMPRFMSAQCVL